MANIRDELTATGKAPGTVNPYLATLASVMTAPVKDWHWLPTSPMSQITKPGEHPGALGS